MLRQHDGAVIGASDHEGVEQVFDGDGLARLDAEAAAAERCGVGAGLDRVGQCVASGVEVFEDALKRFLPPKLQAVNLKALELGRKVFEENCR